MKKLSECILVELNKELTNVDLPTILNDLNKLEPIKDVRKMRNGHYKFTINNKYYSYNPRLHLFSKYDFYKNRDIGSYSLSWFFFKILNTTYINLQTGNKTIDSFPLDSLKEKSNSKIDKFTFNINGVDLHLYLPVEISNEYGIFRSPTYNKQTNEIDYYLDKIKEEEDTDEKYTN